MVNPGVGLMPALSGVAPRSSRLPMALRLRAFGLGAFPERCSITRVEVPFLLQNPERPGFALPSDDPWSGANFGRSARIWLPL